MLKLSLQDATDLLVGCTILGTGGGGSLEEGIALAEQDYADGLCWQLMEKNEVEDNALYTSPYFCGSIGPEDPSGDPYEKYEKKQVLETIPAVEALERFLGQPVGGLVSIEYGGLNTAVALSTAARMGKSVMDADAAGRAVPDLQFSTFYVAGKSITPLAFATSVGDCGILSHAVDDWRAEALVRALSVVSGNMVGMTDHPVTGRELRDCVIWGALSYARQVGRAQRVASAQGENPITAILSAADGWELFAGAVNGDCEWKNEAGFTPGLIHIRGTGRYDGHSYKIWFKNENMISWLDEQPHVLCPDLICVVDQKTGYPILNPHCMDQMEVAVLGFKAPEVWRHGKGLSILNPSFFGFDYKWIPIEELMK